MRTKTTVAIEADVDPLQLGYWDTEMEKFTPIIEMDAAELQTAAAKLDCSELLLEALMMFAASISEIISRELKDI